MLKSRIFSKEIKIISFDVCNSLKDYATLHSLDKNQVIYYKGHYPYGIFIVSDGEILIEKSKRNKVIAKAPIILGYDSFIKNEKYSTTSITLTKSNVFYISKTRYYEEIHNKNEILNLFRNF
ncbi:MAG: hypothetical protein KatS3mg068_0417 [Candidatus Sericytochromatia bacterium]|nr:MAG: hypothetical protein KatS3mg068_0417 [Candidatus Sericytochromatia bacterium]